MTKAVIFDMDGLMADTEPLQSRSFEAVLKEYGIEPELNEHGLAHVVGLRGRDNWKFLMGRYKFNEDLDVLYQKKKEIYFSLIEKYLVPQPGLQNLIRLIAKKKIPMTVASNSALEQVKFVVARLGLTKYFSYLESGYDLEKGKPHPAIFLRTAKKLNVEPTHCLVLEDTQVGVEAAKNADMKVIAVPNRYTEHQNFAEADLVVRSLEKIDWDLIKSL